MHDITTCVCQVEIQQLVSCCKLFDLPPALYLASRSGTSTLMRVLADTKIWNNPAAVHPHEDYSKGNVHRTAVRWPICLWALLDYIGAWQ